MEDLTNSLTNAFSGPVFTNYVWWILRQAKKRGGSTIYFLARDGYLLCEIAKMFCDRFHLDIDCRYLYCSRTALRMPSYHLIGQEAFELLLTRTQHESLHTLLSRAELTEDQQQMLCAEIGMDAIPPDEPLTAEQIQNVEQGLGASARYRELVIQNSKAAYPNAMRYFEQEGLLSQDDIILADSGWMGSMQRSMRQLLRSAGYMGKITGLYFGMYCEPASPQDGEYLTWYFDSNSRFFDTIRFNNNLFECLLAAPHGMTVGYRQEGGRFLPIQTALPSEAECQRILRHIEQVKTYAAQYLSNIRFDDFDERAILRDTKRRVLRYMTRPTAEEAAYYGQQMFCDDVTEAYHQKLADPSQLEQLSQYLVWRRLYQKLTGQNRTTVHQGLYWPYGTMAFLPAWKRLWYRLNYHAWQWLEHIRYS